MSTQQPALSRRRINLALATLFLGTFVLGTAELIVVGVLDVIADDLHVSIPAAGTLVTAYALGVSIGGPVLTALTIKLDKRTVLLAALVLCIVGNLIPVLTADFGLFVAARAVTGALGGLFVAVAFVVGIAIVGPERMGRAISVVFGGFAVSGALGVPLGTLMGQSLGWRGTFTGIVVFAVLTLAAALAVLPSVAGTGGGAGNQARYAFAPRVLAMLFLQFLVFASVYSALTYIVPFLEGVTGISGALVSVFLLAYGVATAVGSIAGGRFADQNAARTLIVATIGTAVALLALHLVGAIAFLVALVMLAWGLFALGMVPSLQHRVVSLAGPGGALASSLPPSAANVGIAFGSVAGGVAIGSSATASSVVIAGLVIAVVSVPVAWATSFLKPPVIEEAAGPAAEASPTPEPA
jgi:MFS transporter, DHA1 family, inner membrane transport protein